MKRINTLLAMVLCLAISISSNAQTGRYLEQVFDEVQVTSDIVYATNATILFLPDVGEMVPQDLMMDVYEPVGDTRDERPLVLLFHTGNFLPIVRNGGVTGLKTDSSAVEMCTRLAKMGYTCASVDYRQGWNPLAATQPERALGLIQSAYRGIQDGRTAVRYFKKDYAEDGNQFKVDTSRITCWGNGTGGYLVLGMVGVDKYSDVVTTTHGPGKFLLDLVDNTTGLPPGDGIPETPMVVEAYHGDIEGKVLTIAPDGAFGMPAGDTTNMPNHVDYSSDFQLSMNVGGALGDISWLEDEGIPTITVHSAYDMLAPYYDDVLIVPTTGDPIVRVQGGGFIGEVQNGFGNNDPLGTHTDPFTMQAETNSGFAGHQYWEGVYPVTNPLNSFGRDEGVAIDWWDPNSPAPGAGMGIPWNLLPHPLDPTGMTSFHEIASLQNENMSAEKARTNIDTIMAYFAPRAYLALDLELVNTDNITAEEVNLEIAPNPATSEVTFRSAADNPMKKIQLFDINGRLLQNSTDINESSFVLQRGNIPTGMYISMITFEEGVVAKKLVFE